MHNDQETGNSETGNPVTSNPQQGQQSPPAPLRFGVLGTGRITRRLVADLQQTPGVIVTGIASRDATRARWYADQFGIPHGFHGYQTLLESDEIDAVYLALPPAAHSDWALAAAQAGKHLLCEKPLTVTFAEAQQLDQACRQANVFWLDATGWLHHPRTAAMESVCRSGRLGQLRHITSAVSFFEPFQSDDHRLEESLGGSCLLDLGWYAVGLAVWAAGGMTPQRVVASGLRRRGICYRASALLEFEHDLSATIQCGYDIATRKWMEVAGEDAAVICDDFTRPWGQRPARFWIHDRAGDVESQVVEGHQEQYMIAALRDEIWGHKQLDAFRRQALATQETIETIAASL